ncbi:MAG: phosphoglycerate dehydrogenase [Candidatus Omnitrophica bacterium]|nr:phosphoglycerate dehydrogenase [Candidatus Omnitrophota bacterium]MCM8826078.1 phosphoglycerate dehydrogenase [Candidatus Omnitrophota bacterium]
MVKILVADKLSSDGISILKEGGFEVDCKTGLSKEDLKEIIKDYEAIVVRSETKLTADVIEAGSKLKIIGRAGVGLDNVDVGAATKKGIIVMNSPGGNTISTCEHTFALMLSLVRKIPFGHSSLKNKEWNRGKFKGVEIYSKILGVIGLGRIGREVAKRAIAFGMEVLAYDPFISPEVVESLGVRVVDLKELLSKSDIVTIHTPLTDDTKNMISYNEFSLMKPTAFIINCARGGIINEDALYQVLKDKKIAGAALDVFEKEPPLNSPLLDLDNVVVTPHLGASTEEAQLNVSIEIAQCIKDALLGKAIRNAANYVQIEPEVYKIIAPYMNLGEKMGRFISQLVRGGAQEIRISYLGELNSFKVEPIGMALVKGFLYSVMGDNVNLINSLELAKERGIKIEQTKVSKEESYVNLIKVKVKTDKEERSIEGTLFSNREPRFVKLDDFYIEISPSDYMLVIQNWDKPGVIGSLGTVLGSYGVNIANMSLGRRAPMDVAITVLNLDTALDEKVMNEIKANPNIISLKFIKL